MGMSRSEKRASRLELQVRRYESRQGVPRIGAEYQPAIRAVRGEAPSLSRCSQIFSARLNRFIHVLSRTEAAAAMIALHCPALIDLQEQRCLPPEPSSHPASPYSGFSSCDLPMLPGTVRVAGQLGLFRFHPRFVTEDEEGPYYVPVPLVGDFLLILRDVGGAYAVNWNVKLTAEAFDERLGERPLRRRSAASVEKARARQRIEEVCYGAAGIPTHRVVGTTFDRTLVANLQQLIPWDSRRTNLQDNQREEMLDAFRGIVGSDRTPLDLLAGLCARLRCDRQDCFVVLYQAIWRRDLIVDLFKPILFNAPLRAQQTSPFELYSYLFARGAQ